jgi:recombination protein RecR
MTVLLPKPVQKLVKVFAKLPGVGSRTAMRFMLHLVREGDEGLAELARALDETRSGVRICQSCRGLADSSGQCDICRDPSRDGSKLCVVEGVGDMLAVETTGLFSGRYFVLQRLLSPLKGIGPETLHLDELVARVKKGEIEEVVLGTPLTTDGEATANYVSRLLSGGGAKVTRLAAGVPVGGSIEYLDRQTLGRALLDRKNI